MVVFGVVLFGEEIHHAGERLGVVVELHITPPIEEATVECSRFDPVDIAGAVETHAGLEPRRLALFAWRSISLSRSQKKLGSATNCRVRHLRASCTALVFSPFLKMPPRPALLRQNRMHSGEASGHMLP